MGVEEDGVDGLVGFGLTVSDGFPEGFESLESVFVAVLVEGFGDAVGEDAERGAWFEWEEFGVEVGEVVGPHAECGAFGLDGFEGAVVVCEEDGGMSGAGDVAGSVFGVDDDDVGGEVV